MGGFVINEINANDNTEEATDFGHRLDLNWNTVEPIPAYNGGPTFREKIEKKFSTPFHPANGNGRGKLS